MEDTVEKALWFCVGAAVGAAIALLYAPQSGDETRKYLRKKAERARDKVVEAGEELAERGKAVYEKGAQVVEEASDLLERGRQWVAR